MTIGLVIGVLLRATIVFGQPADPQRTAVVIEALSRLSSEQINGNPKLQAALKKVLEATRGTAQFVELSRKFHVTNESPALLEIAIQNSTNATGTDALRLIFENGDVGLLRNSLQGTNIASASNLAEALGNLGEKKSVPLLEPLVTDLHRDTALRKHVVHALAQTQEGALALLSLAREGRIGADINMVTSIELNSARWPTIKNEAAQLLPLPLGKNAQPLPSIADLAKRKGDADHGAEVFARPEVGCMNCHQVNGKGVDFGPNLSEIGTKLGKDALYQAILDPSAGISFGYEAWQIELKNGDEVFGLIVSETAEEAAVKSQTGIVSRYKKADIAKRQMTKTSVMPSGLQQTMSIEDLIDLVEYLSALRKPLGQN